MRWFAILPALVACGGFADSSGSKIEDATKYAKLRSEIFQSGDLQKSKPALEAAIKLYAQDGDLWWRLGQARLQARELDASIEAYQQALKLGAFGNKFTAGAYYDIACAYAL